MGGRINGGREEENGKAAGRMDLTVDGALEMLSPFSAASLSLDLH